MKKTTTLIISAAMVLSALCSCEAKDGRIRHNRGGTVETVVCTVDPDEPVPTTPEVYGGTEAPEGKPEDGRDGGRTSYIPTDVTAEELHSYGCGVMFTFTKSNWGEVCSDDDYWVSDIYIVCYDGSVEYTQYFNISDPIVSCAEVSDEDLVFIYETAADFLYSDANGSDDYDSCDAPSYVYILTDREGMNHTLYHTDNPRGALSDAASVMMGYFADDDPEPAEPAPSENEGLDLTGDWEFLLDVADPAEHAEGEDYLTHTQYRVRPDGTVEIIKIYRLSGITYDETFPLYAGDFDLVCELLESGREASEPGDERVEADGMRYQYTFFDSEGEGTVLYTGDNSFGQLPQEVLYNLSCYYRLS